ncbi:MULTISPECIES: hypothetical protein [unclassified Streptomyces]|uniref:hypothetical protein n=1 Tax=unclassified Streptomyces TaxID=2593676 RepID=UPI00081F2A51|nr:MULTISPECIES: hypothetical protein [unclassified Streptomyces]MYR28490.1 hypothetical protein [Streptomyces sp. SID4945]SCF38275.1 hypothetical protein GA0115257_114333 [Streptomyces sp. LcepLS]
MTDSAQELPAPAAPAPGPPSQDTPAPDTPEGGAPEAALPGGSSPGAPADAAPEVPAPVRAALRLTQTPCQRCGTLVAGLNGRYACPVCDWANPWEDGAR